MNKFSDLIFPAALLTAVVAGALGTSKVSAQHSAAVEFPKGWLDTVTYPRNGYKLHRKGTFEEYILNDSSFANFTVAEEEIDTLPKISARDTIKVPDSLRYTDPFRFKYYVALLDSLTHVQVRDSLIKSEAGYWEQKDTVHARLDSAIRHRIDSIYVADSASRAKAAFIAWYNSLSKAERKKYDYTQMEKRKMHEADSIRKIKEEQKAVRDSITENTPRILESYYIPDSLSYKRLISWTVDPDFHKMDFSIPDTSFNKYIYDQAFRRADVNSTWLGVSGSPVQPYNFFKRKSQSGTDFITPSEAWTFTPATLPHYNTKTPYTELAYWGTLFSKESKESDNVHFLTTQNILPELNFQILYDSWKGGGYLTREDTDNKTFSTSVNYTGKKYLLHTGYIHNRMTREENGGISDDLWIRDTTVDSRDIPINLNKASSEIVTNTFFLEQQFRIPFTFIEKIKAKKDSTYQFNPDSIDVNSNITTAFIGHSSEYSAYRREYTDVMDTKAADYYHGYTRYLKDSNDSLGMKKLDNKVFLRLQPWSKDAVVSKLDVGIGDRLKFYWDQDPVNYNQGKKETWHSIYLYAGVEGQFKNAVHWDAKGDYVLLGSEFSDFGIQANASLTLHPFRKAKKSPLQLKAHFETNLREPDFYQQTLHLNHFGWDNSFKKISTTKIEGRLDVPHWNLEATVGYALLGNNIYYDTLGICRQNTSAMSVFSTSLRKDFNIGGWLHLDNKVLFQLSSNQEVLPLPKLALNMRYYFQFVVAKDQRTHTQNVLVMQIGANVLYNTPWYAQAWNPNVGVFYNQNKYLYTNGPVIDAFINMQWKKACIFVKFENVGQGWPLTKKDYFSAAHFINPQRCVKLGIFWPFYIQPRKGGHSHSHNESGLKSKGGNNILGDSVISKTSL